MDIELSCYLDLGIRVDVDLSRLARRIDSGSLDGFIFQCSLPC